MTYQILLQTIRKRLQDQEIENATFESHELICHCTRMKKADLFRDLLQEVPVEVETKINDLLSRRLTEEPLAYLLGEWDFYGLTFDISRDVLIPRQDTEVLCMRGIQIASQVKGTVLDLCTGSGCIGISVAKAVPSVEVVLGDISEKAREIAKKNILRHEVEGRVVCGEMDCLKHPSEVGLGEVFSLILSNPPYINKNDMGKLPPSVANYEPHLALFGGEDGYDFYRSIINQWKDALKPNGHLIMEVGIYQWEMVESLMEQAGFEVLPHYDDSMKIIRVVEGKKKA